MEQNNEIEPDIRDAAAIAFGLLSARATSHEDRERNRSQAMKIILAAIKGGGTHTKESPCQGFDKRRGRRSMAGSP